MLLLFQTLIEEWRFVFISGAAVLFICNFFFIIFGSAKTQSWNFIQNKGTVFLDITIK